MPTLSLRWTDDGPVNFQSIVKKSQTTNLGSTWSAPITIYDETASPPPGLGTGQLIEDLVVGVPTQKGYALNITGPILSHVQWVYIPSDSSTSPVVVDSTNRPAPVTGFSVSRSGPWVDGSGNLWIVGLSPVLHLTTVYKSTNNGSSWTLMDNAHAIAGANVGNWYWDEVGNNIQFVLADASGFIQLQEFNTSTGLYTAAHDSNTLGPNDWFGSFPLVSGTTCIVFFQRATGMGGNRECYVAIFSGGSWTTTSLLVSADSSGNRLNAQNTFCCTCATDNAAAGHLVYGYVGAGNFPVMFYRHVTSGGVLTTPFAFPVGPGNGTLTGAPNDAVQMPYIDQGGSGTILMPARGFHPVSGNLVPLIFSGVPLSAPVITGPTPVWDNATAQYYGGMIALESGSPPTLACPTITTGVISIPLVPAQLQASGGTPPYTYAIISGSLPPGLALNTATGIISGTPTARGTFSYTAQVTDANGLTATVTCQFVISQFFQVVFQGVRRQRGKQPPLIDKTCYDPHALIITASGQLTTIGTLPVAYPAVSVIQHVFDYPFEWHELKITFSSAGGVVPTPAMALFLYDAVGNQLSNLPVLDHFYNGAPKSKYVMGAQVPPLIFPANSNLRADLFSLVQNAALLPVTVNLHFVGFTLIPK